MDQQFKQYIRCSTGWLVRKPAGSERCQIITPHVVGCLVIRLSRTRCLASATGAPSGLISDEYDRAVVETANHEVVEGNK